MFINQILTKLKSLVYSKSETDSLLNGKASSSHTHTKSQITDFPTIPSKVSQLTNDSGFITSSGSCNYANSSGNADTLDGSHAWQMQTLAASGGVHGSNDWLMQCQHNVDGDGYFKLYCGDKSVGTKVDRASSAGYADSAGSAGSATTAGEVNTSVAAGSTKNLVYAAMSNNDQCRIMCGGDDNAGYLEIATSDDGNEPIYVRQYNNGTFGSIVRTLTLLDGSGNTQFPGTVTAPTFSGNLNGNCSGTAGGVAWGNVSGRPTAVSQFSNDSGYITTNGAAYPRRVGGVTMNFNWSGQGGQPTWLWGGEDGTNMYVYNPSNFSVNYANSAGYTNWLRTSSHTDHLLHTEWDGGYFWTYVTAGDGGYRAIRVERSNSSGWADSAGGVAWGNVSGRPWALSQFTNDSGFITSEIDSSGPDWVRFKSGVQICWGTFVSQTQQTSVTFGKAFLGLVSYGIGVCPSDNVNCWISARSATGIALSTEMGDGNYRRVDWLAIGTWK